MKTSYKTIGNNRAITYFKKNCSSVNSWLFSGIKGIGKASLAYEIAKELLQQNISTNLLLINTHKITLEQIEKITTFLRTRVHRIVIIDSVDEMNVCGMNALLKISEESASQGTLILISHKSTNLLPTIKSRFREVRFLPLTDEEMQCFANSRNLCLSGAEIALANGSPAILEQIIACNGITIYKDILTGSLISEENVTQENSSFDLIIYLMQFAIARATKMHSGCSLHPLFDEEFILLSKLHSNIYYWEKKWNYLITLLPKEYNLNKTQVIKSLMS